MENLFIKDLQKKAGGVLICDIIDNEKIILLGKSAIRETYESFGGKYEQEDISSLHTAIRELIEEFFNLKLSTDIINDISIKIRQNKIIIKQYPFYGMSYLINLRGLNFIFQQIYLNRLDKYNINNNFDLINYIKEREITGNTANGLNEIETIQIFKLNEINQINLRWFTKKIIEKMII